MRNFFQRLFSELNPSEANEQEQRSTFLRVILYFAIGATIIGTLAILIIAPQNQPVLLLNGALTLFLVSLLYIARKGYERLASVLFILLFEFYSAYALYHFGGIHNPVSSTLLVIIMVAAMLLGQLGILLTILATSGITLWLALVEIQGRLPRPSVPVQPLQSWVAYFSIVLAGAVVMYAWYNSIRTVMQRARQEIEQRKEAESNAQQRIRELEALNTISQILVGANDLTTLMNRVGEKIHTIFDAPIAFIALLDEKTNLINFSYYRLNEITSATPIRLGEGMTSQIILRRAPIMINRNWDVEAAQYNVINTLDDILIKASLGVPMLANERAIGALCLQETRHENAFSEGDQRLLTTIASNVAIAIENIRLQNVAQQELQERELAETALRESEERYRLISSMSSDYAFLTRVDENGQAHQEWVSEAFEIITGYTHAEFLAQGGWTPLVHVDDRELDAQSYNKVLKNERVTVETRIWRKDGTLRWVRIYTTPIWDEVQQRVTKFYGAVQDITERKLAEEAVRKSEARLRAVLEHIPYDLWVCDETGRYIMQNFREDTTNIEVIGKTPLEIKGVSLERRQRWQAEHEAALRGQKLRNEYVEYDRAGNKKVFIVSIAPIFSGDKVIGLVGMSIDISDLKLAEEEVRSLNTKLEKNVEERTVELEATIRELEAFSYNISHSVRAPLRGIHGYATILADEFSSQLPAAAGEYIQKIQAGARVMDELITDLLDYNRFGRTRPSKLWVDVKDVVNITLIALLKSVPERQIETRVGDLPPAYADMRLVRVVVHNLLNNAIKFTSMRAVAQIEIGYETQADKTVYYVKDNGIGFDMKFASKLFKVFQRLNEPGRFDGTGVGLAIAERIIQKHGGKIWVEAEPDKGATFFFSLG